jgi:anthranilate synthase component 2
MKILVYDNYDSFTYNLVHLVEHIMKQRVDVYRNDKLPMDEVAVYDKIILSPGPGIPSEAGQLLELIRLYAPVKSILGVCLGHQAIGESFGGKLINLSKVYHGVATPINIGKTTGIFAELPSSIEVGRYHSWVVGDKDFPAELEITARDEQGLIMAMKHRTYDVTGVQFHPESVLTPDGEKMMRNWLKK